MNPSRNPAACLLGGALGDSLGLPAECLAAGRIASLWPGPLRHRFVFGRGMVSDDTEHAVMTILSLRKSGGDPDLFTRDLAGRLRWWFAGVPAGIGLATARSGIKLWCGIHPARSGVWSAGNGPLMRAPVIGFYFQEQPALRETFVTASTRITHTDPRALEPARMIAAAAAMAARRADAAEILDHLETLVESDEMKLRHPLIGKALANGISVRDFADQFGRKPGYVSGFAPDTAAVALFAWLRHRMDFRATVESVISAGGDTDTVAFVAGSLAGIECGVAGMPEDWKNGLCDRPFNTKRLADPEALNSLHYPNWPLSMIRNALFLCIVLAHAFRRILPPYAGGGKNPADIGTI